MSETETGLHPIFMDCVDKNHDCWRYEIRKPWVSGGYWYASDGRIAVRQRTVGMDTKPDGFGFPSMLDLGWNKSLYAADPVELPDIPDVELTRECPECKGMGTRYWGRTPERCEDCDGTGREDVVAVFDVGGVIFAARYIRLLRRHGAKLYLIGDNKPSRLELGDIEGIVMPVMRLHSEHNQIWTAEQYRTAVEEMKEPTK